MFFEALTGAIPLWYYTLHYSDLEMSEMPVLYS